MQYLANIKLNSSLNQLSLFNFLYSWLIGHLQGDIVPESYWPYLDLFIVLSVSWAVLQPSVLKGFSDPSEMRLDFFLFQIAHCWTAVCSLRCVRCLQILLGVLGHSWTPERPYLWMLLHLDALMIFKSCKLMIKPLKTFT